MFSLSLFSPCARFSSIRRRSLQSTQPASLWSSLIPNHFTYCKPVIKNLNLNWTYAAPLCHGHLIRHQFVIVKAFYPLLLAVCYPASSAYTITHSTGCRTLLVVLLLPCRSTTTLYGGGWCPRLPRYYP